MTAIYLMLPVSLLLALIFLIAYVWSVRSGQYDDTRTPALRILTDDAGEMRGEPVSKKHLSYKNP
ncbi:MAG: cbb3-type cytochrome oxidase assembly protein CcoS [Verrucomicrobia bacterium]|jgi:cbb3-type cytochrome oxidase maturation protein|nr:cbb3-type cytochrome oxidase assembly protein CcoS [Verrucomicrobiota bacterium]